LFSLDLTGIQLRRALLKDVSHKAIGELKMAL